LLLGNPFLALAGKSGRKQLCYADVDGDGYGDPAISIYAGNCRGGYVENNLDCNDDNPGINPEASEICDGVDNDCDSTSDDGSDEPAPLNSLQAGVCLNSVQICVNGAWSDDYSSVSGYETDETSCDGLDNDCDSQEDEGLTITFYRDFDGDAFGNPSETLEACFAAAGYVAAAGDCDDSAIGVNPAAAEICEDGIDQNCDGIDDVCSTTVCLSCHDGTDPLAPSVSDFLVEGHGKPGVGLGCDQCHVDHLSNGSGYKYLKEVGGFAYQTPYPDWLGAMYSQKDYCSFACHSDPTVLEGDHPTGDDPILRYPYKSYVNFLEPTASVLPGDDLPLLDADQDLIQSPRDIVMCVSCHDPHGKAGAPMMLREPGYPDLMPLCARCHPGY